MKLVKIPGILKKLFPDIIWNIREKQPVLCLTFDDGPTPGVTDGVLDCLEHYGAKATFFCIGRNVERHPDIYERILQAGHLTGNHTYSHLKGWYTPDREYYDDIALAAQFVKSDFYRPAYGMITPAQVRFLRRFYHIVLWDVMSYDFDIHTSPRKCLQNVISNAGAGSVVVFHDSVKAADKVLFALPKVLEHFAAKGYQFHSLPRSGPGSPRSSKALP